MPEVDTKEAFWKRVKWFIDHPSDRQADVLSFLNSRCLSKFRIPLKELEAEMNTIRDHLACYAHKAWAGWMDYLFRKSVPNPDGSVTIPAWAVERWKRQVATPYIELTEAEKESDLERADEILSILIRQEVQITIAVKGHP